MAEDMIQKLQDHLRREDRTNAHSWLREATHLLMKAMLVALREIVHLRGGR